MVYYICRKKFGLNMEIIQKNKEEFITGFFILSCLGLYSLFPTVDNFQKIITLIVFFVLIPVLYDKFILKRNLTLYRTRLGEWKKGLLYSIGGIFFGILIILGLIKFSNLMDGYRVPVQITKSFGYFVFYELGITFLLVVIYEFFFRGFVMFHFVSLFKRRAILMQFLVFVLFLTLTSSFSATIIPYIIFSLIAGLIAYKTNSLLYSFGGQLILIIIVDVMMAASFIK